MGQKSNLITLRKNFNSLNLSSSNRKVFLYSLNFISLLKKILLKKNIFVSYLNMNFFASKVGIHLFLFYRTQKILQYKKKIVLKKIYIRGKNLRFITFLANPLFLSSVGFYALKIVNINLNLCTKSSRKLISSFYLNLKKFQGVLFLRKFNLFIDVIKMTVLFIGAKIDSSSYLYFLSLIFKALSKRKHSKFLLFLSFIFNLIVFKTNNCCIQGLCFEINGKLKGKTRRSTAKISAGRLFTQSLCSDIQFSKNHVYTLYGVFGVKLWVTKI